MARISIHVVLSFLFLAWVGGAAAQGCQTNQNPYCRGNAKLEALCCPYPSVCYWSNRDGQPACCPAGQDCSANGGPGPVVYQTPSQTQFQTQGGFVVSTLSTQYYTTYTLYSSWQPVPTQQYSQVSTAVVIITQTQSYVPGATSAVGGAYTTVTSAVVGAYSTVTQAIGGAYSTASQAVVGGAVSHTRDVPTGFLFMVLVAGLGICMGALLL